MNLEFLFCLKVFFFGLKIIFLLLSATAVKSLSVVYNSIYNFSALFATALKNLKRCQQIFLTAVADSAKILAKEYMLTAKHEGRHLSKGKSNTTNL